MTFKIANSTAANLVLQQVGRTIKLQQLYPTLLEFGE